MSSLMRKVTSAMNFSKPKKIVAEDQEIPLQKQDWNWIPICHLIQVKSCIAWCVNKLGNGRADLKNIKR